MYGGNYHLFNPAIEGYRPGGDDYEITSLKRMYKFFGPFPASFKDFEKDNPDLMTVLNFFNDSGPPEKPFNQITTKEIPPADKEFLLKIMKVDPRDRPTAQELLEDEWFKRILRIQEYRCNEGVPGY